MAKKEGVSSQMAISLPPKNSGPFYWHFTGSRSNLDIIYSYNHCIIQNEGMGDSCIPRCCATRVTLLSRAAALHRVIDRTVVCSHNSRRSVPWRCYTTSPSFADNQRLRNKTCRTLSDLETHGGRSGGSLPRGVRASRCNSSNSSNSRHSRHIDWLRLSLRKFPRILQGGDSKKGPGLPPGSTSAADSGNKITLRISTRSSNHTVQCL